MTILKRRNRRHSQILLMLIGILLINLWCIALYTVEINKHFCTDNSMQLEAQRTIKIKGE